MWAQVLPSLLAVDTRLGWWRKNSEITSEWFCCAARWIAFWPNSSVAFVKYKHTITVFNWTDLVILWTYVPFHLVLVNYQVEYIGKCLIPTHFTRYTHPFIFTRVWRITCLLHWLKCIFKVSYLRLEKVFNLIRIILRFLGFMDMHIFSIVLYGWQSYFLFQSVLWLWIRLNEA